MMQELYTQYRSLLFTLAYQLTGSASDAEDVVQDVFVKVYQVDPERLTEPKAYLCKMVANRCKDLLKSARKRREQYVGEWLPEPIVTSGDGFEAVIREELLSYGMLVLLEKLSVTERSVFVLREALGLEYRDIAEIVDRSESNCRKIVSRARTKMGITYEDQFHAEAVNEQWIHRFIAALEEDNVEILLDMLAEDVVLISDGGGKAIAAIRPIPSRDLVTRFLLGLMRKIPETEGSIQFEIRELNTQRGIIVRSDVGVQTVVLLHVENQSIQNLYFIRNPDKIAHILQLRD